MSEVTILISTSPRPSHPSTHILDATVIHARKYLPDAPIVIMADGILLTTTNEDYALFLNKIRDRYPNCEVQTRSRWTHQSGMLEQALEAVKTPLLRR